MRSWTRFFLTTLSALALCAPALAETDQEVAARQVALELAGAFANDGFKLRDGHWVGVLAPNEGKTVAVNLYAGNEYWFSAGATEKAKKLAVEVFDETGAQVAGKIQLRHESGFRSIRGQ